MKTKYDVIYDDSSSSQRAVKIMENNRRSQSFSYHLLNRIRTTKSLQINDENDSKIEDKLKELSHKIEKQYLEKGNGKLPGVCDGSDVKVQLKDTALGSLSAQSQTFSYPSLKRRRNDDGAGSSVTLITTPTSAGGALGTPRSEVSKAAQVRRSPPTHTQLVNCKGHDEILLDSDNLTSATKFQNCTRRRDESFV